MNMRGLYFLRKFLERTTIKHHERIRIHMKNYKLNNKKVYDILKGG